MPNIDLSIYYILNRYPGTEKYSVSKIRRMVNFQSFDWLLTICGMNQPDTAHTRSFSIYNIMNCQT